MHACYVRTREVLFLFQEEIKDLRVLCSENKPNIAKAGMEAHAANEV